MSRDVVAASVALLVATTSNAAFTGWTAYSRVSGSVLLVDVLANFDGSDARLLSVFDANIAASGASFRQQATLQRKGWAPEADQGPDDHDSFMTIGHLEFGGETFVGSNVQADPNFTSTSGAWSGTIASAPSTSIPANAGWYCVPTSETIGQTWAFPLDTVGDSGSWQNRQGDFGVWVAHFAFDIASISDGATLSFDASAGFRPDAGTGAPIVGDGAATFALLVPAPGAVVALPLLFAAGRGRRRHG